MSWTLFTANILIKGFVVLGVATLMTLALQRASAAARHAVWALALLSLLALPFLIFGAALLADAGTGDVAAGDAVTQRAP